MQEDQGSRPFSTEFSTGQPGLPEILPQAKQKSQSLELVELIFKEEEMFFQEMNVFQLVLSFSYVQ